MNLLTVKKRMTIVVLIQKVWTGNQIRIQRMKDLKKIKRPWTILCRVYLIYLFMHARIINICLHLHVDGFATVYLATNRS